MSAENLATPATKVDTDLWLIWSHEHSAWWKPQSNGYTSQVDRAGRYTLGDALDICAGADGGEWVQNTTRFRDGDAIKPNEVLVLSPESIAERLAK